MRLNNLSLENLHMMTTGILQIKSRTMELIALTRYVDRHTHSYIPLKKYFAGDVICILLIKEGLESLLIVINQVILMLT